MTLFPQKKISLAILTALAATATTAAQANETTQLNPVTVSDSAISGLETTVNSNTLLQNSNSEAGVALKQMSGVEGSRIGGHGIEIFINGQSASQLNVLIDGAKIEGGCPNRMDPPTAYAEMSSFDSVTVIKGVNSVTHGTGGTGGTVLLERNAPEFTDGKSVQGEINAGTTSNGLKQDINATLSAGNDQGYLVVQGAKKSAENYLDGNGDEINSSYESRQGRLDLGWTPNEDNELRLSYEKTNIDDALFQGAGMDSPSAESVTTRLGYEGTNISKNIQALDIDLYSSQVDHLMDNYSLRTPGMMQMETPSSVETKGAKIQLNSELSKSTIIDYGLQFESSDKTATLSNAVTEMVHSNIWPDVKSETKSVFAETTTDLSADKKLIIGLRYDAVTAEATGATVPATLYSDVYTNYSGATKSDESSLNALLRYERTYDNNINLFAGLSRTHRYADATEQFIAKKQVNTMMMQTEGWFGNPDLKPEQHNQLDIGISKASNQGSWSASAFYDVVNNYILRDKAKNQSAEIEGSILGDGSVYLNKDATLYGLELSGVRKSGQNITTSANVNLTKGTNTTDSRNLSNIAPINGNLAISYTANNWDAGTRVNFAMEQTEVNAEYDELETAAWSTLDVYGNYQINKQFKLSAGIDNLGDHAYETHLNRADNLGGTFKVTEAGRTVWAKVNAKF